MNPIAPNATGSGASDAAAALKGASLAFQKKPNAPQAAPSTSTSWRDNGALSAAASAGRSRSPLRPIAAQSTGGSAISEPATDPSLLQHQQYAHHGGLVAARLHQLSGSSSPGAGAAGAAARVDHKNPSFIAATLAASRSVSPSPPKAQTPRKMASHGGLGEAVDAGSLAPTGSLISMFERGQASGDPMKKATPKKATALSSEESLVAGRSLSPGASPSFARDSMADSTPTRPQPVELKGIKEAQLTPMRRKPDVVTSGESEKTSRRMLEEERQAMPDASPTATKMKSPKPKPKPKPKPTTLPEKILDEKSQATSQPLPTRSKTVTAKRESSPQSELSRTRSLAEASNGSLNERPRSPSERPHAEHKSKHKQAIRPRHITPPPRVVSHSTPEVLSPKPVRMTKPSLHAQTPPPSEPVPFLKPSAGSSPDPSRREMFSTQQRAPTPPKPRGSNFKAPQKRPSLSPRPANTPISRDRPRAAVTAQLLKQPPSQRFDTTPKDGNSLSASSSQSLDQLQPPPLPRRRASIASAPGSPARSTPGPRPQASTNSLALDSLTSAIVAGSLASTRLTPQHTGSSLPPPRPSKSPRFRQTLRQPPTSHSEEDERQKRSHGHRHKLRSGKHAHHEGARRKWRDEITQRERKRYEAVWASNRGVLLGQPGTSSVSLAEGGGNTELVANVVVRELWKRSRLPEDELSEVWEAVDRHQTGTLDRQEFVVGMWLIDQRLRGRKIPMKVSDSVWGSANGVKVKKPKIR